MFINGAAVAHAQTEDPDLCIGRPLAFHPEITPQRPPSDRLYPGAPRSARRSIGGPVAFQSPSVFHKDTSKPRESHTGEKRWFVVGYSGKLARAKDDLQRIHESSQFRTEFPQTSTAPVLWTSVKRKVRKKGSERRSKRNRRRVVGTSKIGIEKSSF